MLNRIDPPHSDKKKAVKTTTEGIEMLEGQTFAITFRSKLNETFTTIPIVMNLYDTIDLSNDIRLALLSLPINEIILIFLLKLILGLFTD